MNKINGDIVARIRLLTTEEGGRQSPTPTGKHSCIFFFSDKYYDCWLILEDVGSIVPGNIVQLPIKFLTPNLILDKLHKGDKFTLMESTIIGEGEVVSIK